MSEKTYEAILAENEKFLKEKGLILKRITNKKDIRLAKDRMVGIFVMTKKNVSCDSIKKY